jgi:hypothetical protein
MVLLARATPSPWPPVQFWVPVANAASGMRATPHDKFVNSLKGHGIAGACDTQSVAACALVLPVANAASGMKATPHIRWICIITGPAFAGVCNTLFMTAPALKSQCGSGKPTKDASCAACVRSWYSLHAGPRTDVTKR